MLTVWVHCQKGWRATVAIRGCGSGVTGCLRRCAGWSWLAGAVRQQLIPEFGWEKDSVDLRQAQTAPAMHRRNIVP